MSVLNLHYLQTHFGDNPVFIREVLQMFKNTVPRKLQKIKGYIEAEDWEAIYQIAHSLKATVKLLGMEPLYENMIRLETASKKKSKEELMACSKTANELAAAAKQEITEILESLD